MSDLLSIGASGLRAYSRALSTVGDNIANAQTPGYARRTVQLQDASAAGDSVLYRNNVRPGGVLVAGVSRAVDNWLIADSRVAAGDAGRNSARLEWMAITERALDDGATGVGASMTAVFNAADRLSANPSDTTLRGGFLQAVDDTAAAFRRTAASLESTSNGIAADAQGTVNGVNANLTALQRVNEGLLRAREGSTNVATLMDERDRLIDDISGAIGVTVTFDGHGAATLRSAGPGAETLLDGPTKATLSVAAAPDGRLAFGVAPPGGSITPVSGALAGLADAANINSDRRASLDSLATSFANDLNTRHQAGLDAQGNPGVALLTIGGGAASLNAAALTNDQVAAADSSGANGNMLAFSGLRGSTGAEANWAAMVSAHSQATSSARAQDAASTTRLEGAFDARDNISEVDLDHEAAELLRFQQAYEAAARTIQVARETMQSILSIF